MDFNKIGLFIKQLRKDNKISQQQLADMIPIDRSGLSRWENGEVLPPIDKMKKLCEILNVSIDELLSGEKTTQVNKNEQQKNLFDYLITQDSKYKKIKKVLLWVLIVLFITVITFLIYYFFQTYNTEKTYKIYTTSNDYIVKNGLLVTTRETSYFKLGGINDEIYDITLYYKKDDKDIIIFKGDSDLLLVNLYYEDKPVNSKAFNKIKNNLYVKVNDVEVKLYFNEFYKNKNIIFKEWEDKYDIENQVQIESNSIIPDNIKKEFNCDKDACSKLIDNIQIYYMIADNVIFVKDGDVNIQYDISRNDFDFNNEAMIFNIENGKLDCHTSSCNEYEKMYEKYFTNIIKKYI